MSDIFGVHIIDNFHTLQSIVNELLNDGQLSANISERDWQEAEECLAYNEWNIIYLREYGDHITMEPVWSSHPDDSARFG